MGSWDSRNRRDPRTATGPAEQAAAFRNLCRSSPWKWQSLRFEFADRPAGNGGAGTVSAWLRRPGALRIESAGGQVLHRTTGINDSRDGLYVSASRKSWLLPPQLLAPVYDDGGLVRRRPEAAYGEPGFGSGRFAAALDPVELAGNAPVPLEFPRANPVELGPVSDVDHEGRPALETIASPNSGYRPLDPAAPLCRPGRTLLRVDVGTGVCVLSLWLDAVGADDAAAGEAGHWLRILAVDEYMPDDLFVAGAIA